MELRLTNRVAQLGWGAFVCLGLAVAGMSGPAQLIYAGVAILVLGLPHGASDLARVPAGRRVTFLLAYLLSIAVLLVWWKAAPFTALVAFLILSAVHFGLDDAPASRPVERLMRGVLMVAGPALLHRSELTQLFVIVTTRHEEAAALATGMAMLALAATAAVPLVLLATWRRGDGRGAALLGGGVMALLVLPPLVGFAIGFVILHARVQLRQRMTLLGCDGIGHYLRVTAPVLLGATAVLAVVAALFARGDSPGLPTLFAGIAALAIPHMLVTPLWAGARPRAKRDRPYPTITRGHGRAAS